MLRFFNSNLKKLNRFSSFFSRGLFMNRKFIPHKMFSSKDDKAFNMNTEELITGYLEEFEKTLASGEDNQDKRVKLLSIKLLQMTNAKEVTQVFEEKYIKGLLEKIYAEELTLFLYFYVSLIDKEKKSAHLITIDKKVDRMVEMIGEKISELDQVNLLALIWAFSILITQFKYNIPVDLKKSIIRQLPEEIMMDKKGEIPTICFSISSFNSENDKELKNLIEDKVKRYSHYFCKDIS